MPVLHGCALVDPDYEVDHGQGSLIANGIYGITDVIGLSAVKMFLSSAYQTIYNQTWPGGITSLTTLAQSTPMADVLADPTITHYFFNCFSFNDGAQDLWKFGFGQQPTYLASEYTEIRALAEYLLTTYAGTGKTFVLQNWEGDWALLNSRDANNLDQPTNDPTNEILPDTVRFMRSWLRTRINAIADARRAIGQNGVRVLSAIELNRIRDAWDDRSLPRVINSVLPGLHPDYVSYSSYDTLYGPGFTYYGSQAELIANTAVDMGRAIDLIRRAAPHSGVYIGEYGFPENELPVGYSSGDLTESIGDLCDAKGIPFALYWEMWGNEGGRGFWLEDSLGALSGAGTYLSSL